MNETQRTSIADKFRNTQLGFLRIKKNLEITEFTDFETEKHLKNIILSTPLESIERKGKNYYFICSEFNTVLTINAYTLTIITAKKVSRFQKEKILI